MPTNRWSAYRAELAAGMSCDVNRLRYLGNIVRPDGRSGARRLKRQIGYALDVGLSKREICETLSQAGWYRGWPYVEDALTEAKKVFAERGV